MLRRLDALIAKGATLAQTAKLVQGISPPRFRFDDELYANWLTQSVQALTSLLGGGDQLRRVTELIRNSALLGHLGELLELVEPAFGLLTRAQVGSAWTNGRPRSRLGGLPLLEPGQLGLGDLTDRALAFVGQIDLSEVAPFDVAMRLPRGGLLLFFADRARLTNAQPAQASGGSRVMYVHDTSALVPAEPPMDLPDEAVFGESWIQSSLEYTLPPLDSVVVQQLQLDLDQSKHYVSLLRDLEALQGVRWPVHRLLGHPLQRQGDLLQGDARRQLLLQVDSDEAAGMMWGDVGTAYYLARRQDLAAGNFKMCDLVVQSA